MHLGAHVPITGGVVNAPGHGDAIGAEAIQMPLVVETPGPLAEWKKEIACLGALVRPADGAGKASARKRSRARR